MKRRIRDRHLTPDEAAKYSQIREQVAAEVPTPVARQHKRVRVLEEPTHRGHTRGRRCPKT